MGLDAVHGWMEVEYSRARWQHHHLALIGLIRTLTIHPGRDGGEWCNRQCRRTSSTSKDTVDKDRCFVSKMNCCNNVKKHLDGHLPTHTITSQPCSEKAAPRLTFSTRGPSTLVRFLSSGFTCLQSVYSRSQFQHPLDLEKHTASAFNL